MKVYLEEELKVNKSDKILIVGCGNSSNENIYISRVEYVDV
jgi:lysine/ornithine N-monooxygenase